jgi:hypothetical protein
MGGLRTPLFVLALILIGFAVLIEIGSAAVLQSPGSQLSASDVSEVDEDLNLDDVEADQVGSTDQPGLAIQYLALVDSIVLFTVGLMGVSLLVPERIHGRIQGIITLIFSLILLMLCITLIFAALGLVLLMVSLFVAVPFGTLTYLAIYGAFDRGGASAVLSFLMLLKIGFAVCLVLAHQRFLQNKGLMLIVLTALLANVIVSLLHGIVPIILVSITDGIAAIIVGILAAIWAIILLVGAIIAVLKAVRLDRSLSS